MILKVGKENKGIALIEICLVCAILSLLFAISWPLLNRASRKTQMEMTCNEIANAFRYARDYSLNESRYYCVEFDTQHRQYWLTAKNPQAQNPDAFTPINDSLHKKRYWGDGILTENITNEKVVFYPDGTSQDFEISFKNVKGDTCKLVLSGSTGKISIIDE